MQNDGSIKLKPVVDHFHYLPSLRVPVEVFCAWFRVEKPDQHNQQTDTVPLKSAQTQHLG